MFNNIDEFYPTPKSLIHKMLKDIDFREIRTVLEPSAGKGDIAEEILNRMKQLSRNLYCDKDKKYDIDCVEIDQNLRYILQGKGFKVIHDDFLTYEGFKQYDLIVMNPPFSNGDKHILKALELIKNGGKLVAIINAETIKNPYSNSRKDLLHKLNELNGSIEYLQQEFSNAERQTDVEIALIKINKEKVNSNSIIVEHLKNEEQYRTENHHNSNSLINADFLQGIIQQYQFEIRAGLKLIEEYNSIQPLILKSFKKDGYSGAILNLSVDTSRNDMSHDTMVNAYIKKVRYKYWEALFNNEQFTSLLTSNLLWEFRNKINELVDYDFSYFNIKEIQLQMSKNMIKGVEDTILNLFEEFSHKHSWHEDINSNIHYYNGWKTNKAWMINKKIIIPLSAYSWVTDRLDYTYKFYEKLKDIQRVFDYLDGGKTDDIDLKQRLEVASTLGQTRNIMTKYFSITTYKKGTTHLTFLDDELLKKFNIFGCQRKGFLPPSYGKKKYKNMTNEEQEVINEFEGEKSYNDTIQNTEYYLYNPSKILAIG